MFPFLPSFAPIGAEKAKSKHPAKSRNKQTNILIKKIAKYKNILTQKLRRNYQVKITPVLQNQL
jgi:hypothetical protein